MKKLAFLFLVSFAFCGMAYAQNTSIGLRGGLVLASLIGPDAPGNSGAKAGFMGGVFLNYSINEQIGTSFELNYAQRGNRSEAGNNDEILHMNYVEFNLYGSYFFGEGDLRPKLFAGPYAAYLLNAKRTFQGFDTEEDLTDRYTSTDFGLLLGAGLHYRIGEGIWFIGDIRYNYGLVNLPEGNVARINTGAFAATVGVSFPLGNIE